MLPGAMTWTGRAERLDECVVEICLARKEHQWIQIDDFVNYCFWM